MVCQPRRLFRRLPFHYLASPKAKPLCKSMGRKCLEKHMKSRFSEWFLQEILCQHHVMLMFWCCFIWFFCFLLRFFLLGICLELIHLNFLGVRCSKFMPCVQGFVQVKLFWRSLIDKCFWWTPLNIAPNRQQLWWASNNSVVNLQIDCLTRLKRTSELVETSKTSF